MADVESVSFGKIRRRKRTAKKDIIFNVIIYTILTLFAIVTVYPVIIMLAYSFNDRYDALNGVIYLFPRKWSLGNYKNLFTEHTGWGHAALVTLARTAIGTITALASTALLSFILSRKRFLFRSVLSFFWVFTMYAQGGIITTVVLYRRLHLTDNFWVYIIPGMISVINMIVIRTYMQSIPDSLEESAQLEGAGYMRIFWSIISPQCKPVYAAIALFTAAYHWNAWFDVRLYNRFSMQYSTLQYEMMKFYLELTPSQGLVPTRSPTPVTVKAAAAVLTMIPLLVIYPFFQKYFVTGLTVSGIKE